MTKAFDPNDWAAVQAALDDPDPHNPIARAIAARLESLMGALHAATENGGRPDRIEITKPATAVDAAAIDLFRAVLAAKPGSPALVVMEHGRQ